MIRDCVLRVVCGVLLVSVSAAADAVDAGRVACECRFAAMPPRIDGVADDAVWKSAQLIDNFTLPWLKEKSRPARTATRARLAWDREFLYFAAEMDDADLFADITEHDGKTWDNDVFELFFKPAVDKSGYYEFQVNAAGTVMDMFIPRREAGIFERHVKEGRFHVDAKVTLDGTLNTRTDVDRKWTVEGRIPWTDFLRTGGRPTPDEVWKFALCRYDYAVGFDEPELSTCAPLQQRSFHQHEDYADLKFVGPGGKSSADAAKVATDRFEPHAPLAKLTTSRVAGSPEPPAPYRTQRRYPKLKVDFPISLVHQPGSDRLWTITQDRSYSLTSIRRFVDSEESTETELLLPSDNRVAYDICFHPEFASNGYVYVGHNRPKAEGGEKYSIISRFKVNPKPPFEFDPASETTIIEWPSDGHNGAAITFGNDGMMYVTSGDGTSDSDTNLRGQDLTKLTAKVLRIDVDHPAPGKTYAVPPDNPFVGQADVVPETWAYGLRNPWRMTTDRKTGHIWVGNNGQDLWEQVYFVSKGDNFGWSVHEGSHPFYLARKLGPSEHVKPALEHHHSESRSLTGGIVYYGRELPGLVGAYIYGDHSTGKIWGARHDGQKVIWHQELVDTPFHITGFGTDLQGELLVCDHAGNGEGGFHRLIPAETTQVTSQFPMKLSDSGLFQSVKGHVTQPSLIPYSVNSPLWSDGSIKARFIAIPGDNPRIDFKDFKSWGFPNETVLVKSFGLEMVEGDPESRRWIETRFLTRQQNEWVGYTYVWNDEQSDATLVAKEGQDREFTIKTPSGTRNLPWHYPSRTECMVCHSRAAAFVLGLNTAQLNRDHDYGGTVDNQLNVLERLGLFHDLDWAGESRNRLRADLKKSGLNDKEVTETFNGMTASSGQRAPAKSGLLSFANEKYERLADPYDPSAKLEARAKSYLHTNCAICHVEAGGGNAQMQLEFATSVEKMKIVNETPYHDKFGLADARLVAPGHPERSVLLHRMSIRGRGQMPQLATSVVDAPAVKMLTEWIRQMEAGKADPPQAAPARVGFRADKLAEIDGLVATAISEKKMPGCVILIGRPDGTVWVKAYGDKRLEPEHEAMTVDTVFDLASLTKPLATATSIMKLVEQGKLSVDDPVVKYLPDFGVESKKAITIRDLLFHRSGLIPDNAISDYQDGPLKAKERLLALKPIAPLGTRFIYSDVNFMVLGEVIAKVSGVPLNEFSRDQIFVPLEMKETTYVPEDALRKRAAPTEKRDGAWMQGEVHDPRAYRLDGIAGHAGLFGTAHDLAKYATDALAGMEADKSRILKQTTWRDMTTPQSIVGVDSKGKPTEDIRGLGWDIRSRYSSNRGTRFSPQAFGHGGFTGTALWIDPGTRLYVIFLSNRVHPNGKGIVNPLAGRIGELAVEASLE